MIYIHIVVIKPLMLHAKFFSFEIGPSVSEKKIFEGFLTIYGHDSHLGHVS